MSLDDLGRQAGTDAQIQADHEVGRLPDAATIVRAGRQRRIRRLSALSVIMAFLLVGGFAVAQSHSNDRSVDIASGGPTAANNASADKGGAPVPAIGPMNCVATATPANPGDVPPGVPETDKVIVGPNQPPAAGVNPPGPIPSPPDGVTVNATAEASSGGAAQAGSAQTGSAEAGSAQAGSGQVDSHTSPVPSGPVTGGPVAGDPGPDSAVGCCASGPVPGPGVSGNGITPNGITINGGTPNGVPTDGPVNANGSATNGVTTNGPVNADGSATNGVTSNGPVTAPSSAVSNGTEVPQPAPTITTGGGFGCCAAVPGDGTGTDLGGPVTQPPTAQSPGNEGPITNTPANVETPPFPGGTIPPGAMVVTTCSPGDPGTPPSTIVIDPKNPPSTLPGAPPSTDPSSPPPTIICNAGSATASTCPSPCPSASTSGGSPCVPPCIVAQSGPPTHTLCKTTTTTTTGDNPPPTGNVTLTGTVTAGPACPGPASPGSSCPDKPIVATITFTISAGIGIPTPSIALTTTSNADGTYKMVLPAGHWHVTMTSSAAMSCAPIDVDLTAVANLTQDLHCDTGIR